MTSSWRTSWPASSRLPMSRCQVAKRSAHATTENACRPMTWSSISARQRSLPSESIGMVVGVARAWRQVLHADQHDVVAVDERIGLDDQPVTDDALDREAAASTTGVTSSIAARARPSPDA